MRSVSPRETGRLFLSSVHDATAPWESNSAWHGLDTGKRRFAHERQKSQIHLNVFRLDDPHPPAVPPPPLSSHGMGQTLKRKGGAARRLEDALVQLPASARVTHLQYIGSLPNLSHDVAVSHVATSTSPPKPAAVEAITLPSALSARPPAMRWGAPARSAFASRHHAADLVTTVAPGVDPGQKAVLFPQGPQEASFPRGGRRQYRGDERHQREAAEVRAAIHERLEDARKRLKAERRRRKQALKAISRLQADEGIDAEV